MSAVENWNPQDPVSSFRRFAEGLRDLSRDIFLRDGTHAEMFFMISEDGHGYMILAPAKMERDEMVELLRKRICEEKTYGVVHIVESWTYIPKTRGDHTLKQIVQGEIAVSELQPSDRSEALVVMAETRSGWQMKWMSLIRRDGDKISLSSTVEFDERSGGRFAGLFEAG